MAHTSVLTDERASAGWIGCMPAKMTPAAGLYAGLDRYEARKRVVADLEAQGAVEAAASQFGALPEGFRDDALPVVFSFDPRIIR